MASGSPNRNATTDNPAVSSTTSTSSAQREDTSARRCDHNSTGPPITSTAIPSPAHHCSTSPGHQPPSLSQSTVAPTSAPAIGPRIAAPAMNVARPGRVARSGCWLRPNLRTHDAPTSGSTALASAAPRAARSNR